MEKYDFYGQDTPEVDDVVYQEDVKKSDTDYDAFVVVEVILHDAIANDQMV